MAGFLFFSTDDEDLDQAAEKLARVLDLSANTGEFREDVEKFALNTLQSKAFDIPGFTKLMLGMDLSFDDLYRRYVGKNVLNFFRQDHGYQDGTYRKLWSGKEDNEHLVEINQSLDASSPSYQDELYQALEARYTETA